MAQTDYQHMTIEHLGQDATEEDLLAFREACERVMASREFAGDADAATDYVWNNGRIQFEADTCIYCQRAVHDRTVVPAADDDETWSALSLEHDDDCEWVWTRAHRVFA